MTVADPAHIASVEAWREERYRRLRSEIGWLTLAGLGWLKPGLNRIGSADDADVILPGGPPLAGTITVPDDGLPTADGDFLHEGAPVRDLALTSDLEGEPTLLELGALRLCLIDRGGRLAIRTWDTQSPARAEFDGIDHWPVDPAWRVTARLEPTPGRTIEVPDVLGAIESEVSPGRSRLRGRRGDRIGSRRCRAATPASCGWSSATRRTAARRTAAAATSTPIRPTPTAPFVVDFNRAYNPPCVFSPYATCSLPWPANRLPIRIEAGERAYRGY